MPVDTPPSGVITEVVDDPLWSMESAIALVKCDIDPGVSEANDVSTTITSQVSEKARMSVDTPPSGVITEVVDDPLWSIESAIALVKCDIDSGVSEANDVSTTITGQVSKEARMPVDTPPSGVITELVDDPLWGLKGAVTVIKCDIDSGVSEANDVSNSITGQVSEKARMSVDTPPSGVITEVVDDPLRGMESAIALVECNINPSISKTNNVRTTVTSQVGEEARMSVDTPPSGIITEVVDDLLQGSRPLHCHSGVDSPAALPQRR